MSLAAVPNPDPGPCDEKTVDRAAMFEENSRGGTTNAT